MFVLRRGLAHFLVLYILCSVCVCVLVLPLPRAIALTRIGIDAHAHAQAPSPAHSHTHAHTHTRDDPFNCSQLAAAGAFREHWLSNGRLNLSFVAYGGVVTRLLFPDAAGAARDVVLGFDEPSRYCADAGGQHPYFGALIGRVANRIANGSFTLDGRAVTTPINEPAGNDTLHGGPLGFDRRVWRVEVLNASAAVLRYDSADGEEGFPAEVAVEVTYALTEDDRWQIEYVAKPRADTVIALTQHTYWNLNGAQDTACEHVLGMASARRFLEVDEHLLPTGAFRSVREDDWMDFTRPKAVGRDIGRGRVTPFGGYDNAFVFGGWRRGQPPVARLLALSPLSGIAMELITDQPSVQMYSGLPCSTHPPPTPHPLPPPLLFHLLRFFLLDLITVDVPPFICWHPPLRIIRILLLSWSK